MANPEYEQGRVSALAASAFKRWREATERLPGATTLWRGADRLEDQALRLLKSRLDELEDGRATAAQADTPRRPASGGDVGQRLQALIQRSLDQRPERAENELFDFMVAQLVPDETRILAAVSDGSAIAICHVEATNRLGTTSTRILHNASRVGQECGVMLTASVPYYLAHLLELGLLVRGPEDKRLEDKYELLETDSNLRDMRHQIESDMGLRVRLVRETVRLSELGQRFWAAGQRPDASNQQT